MMRTSEEAEQLQAAIDRDLLDPMKQMIEATVQENSARLTHLLSTLSKVEEDMAQDSGDFVAASSLITEVPVTVPTWHMIGGSASEVYVAEGSDLPLQEAEHRQGIAEAVVGNDGGGSSGRDITIGGYSKVQSAERRHQPEDAMREGEEALAGNSMLERITVVVKQA
jgi:hypothetical protein